MATTRLWIAPASDSSARHPLATADGVPAAPSSLVDHADLREPDASETDASFGARISRALDDLARRHIGREIQVLAGPQALRACIAAALEIPSERIAASVASSPSACAIDWPSDRSDTTRPALIGIDLDWQPPPPSPQRQRFPGGPGSAPSTRG